jgi:Uma2 family endonuclease
MPAAREIRRVHTVEEYAALEKVGDARYEYWDGEIVCMSGGSREHNDIASNAHGLLREAARRRGCRAYTEGQAVEAEALPPYRYPDVTVACGPKFKQVLGIDVLTNPLVLVEVTSPTTESADHKAQRRAYQTIESLREYVIVEQDEPKVTLYIRDEDGWKCSVIDDLDRSFRLPSLDCEIALRDLYETVF